MKILLIALSIGFLNIFLAQAQAPQQPPITALPETPEGQEQAEPSEAMRSLIRDISRYARRYNRYFTIVTQGGLEILEKTDQVDATRSSPANTYIRSIDGINIRGLNYHPPFDGKKEIETERKSKENMLRLANIAQKRGLKIFVTDYYANLKIAQKAYRFNLSKGFIPFTAESLGSDYTFDKIPTFPSRPINENPKNMIGLKSVKNFVQLTDSANYDRQQDFVIALSNTNFDVVIVDVFHKGRQPFKKAAIQGMKFKKLGARRLVFAYMNIGAAESYRYYWKDRWKEGQPTFISSATPGNPDKYYVEFWRPSWRKIITGNTSSYIYGIIKQGFDGVLLGGVDNYKFFDSGG